MATYDRKRIGLQQYFLHVHDIIKGGTADCRINSFIFMVISKNQVRATAILSQYLSDHGLLTDGVLNLSKIIVGNFDNKPMKEKTSFSPNLNAEQRDWQWEEMLDLIKKTPINLEKAVEVFRDSWRPK